MGFLEHRVNIPQSSRKDENLKRPEASLFSVGTSCTLNDLTGLRWLLTYLNGRERHPNLGLTAWAGRHGGVLKCSPRWLENSHSLIQRMQGCPRFPENPNERSRCYERERPDRDLHLRLT